MVGVIAWAVAIGIALIAALILGYGLVGQIRRLRAALEHSRADLEPTVRSLLAASQDRSGGRHSVESTPGS